MANLVNIICGLPDDRKVVIQKMGPPLLFTCDGTASFLNQTINDLPWNLIWIGPASPASTRLAPGPIINHIADPDICIQALRAASREAERLQRPWFNHPDRIALTTRDHVSRALQGIDGLIVPKVVRCRPVDVAALIAAIDAGGLRYPVLIRSAGEHGGKTLVRIDGPEDERAFEASVRAGTDLYVTEFHEFADEDGLYRRYRFAVVGGKPFIKSIIMGAGWNLHASSRIWNERTIAQERAIIDGFATDLAPRIRPMTDAIYERLGLDYFGMDCAVRSDGTLVMFEVNANMDILVDIKLRPDLWSESTGQIKAALLALICDPARWVAARRQPGEAVGA